MRLLSVLFLLALCSPVFAADPQQPDLLEAARKGRTKDVEALLAHGGDIEMKDKDGRTPLMLAAQYGRTATVELLLAKGAKPATRDNHGWNAYMLALLAPSGGMVHTAHDKVLRLLPQPKRFRLQLDAGWSPSPSMFSSCFMRPAEMAAHIRDLRPDAMVVDAFQRYAVSSGRGLVAILRADARGTSELSNLAPAEGSDAVLALTVEPGASCVQGSDSLTMTVRAQLSLPKSNLPFMDQTFGLGVKTGMKTESAANPNQHGPLYEAWAKSQAGPIYWAAVEALLLREW